MANGDTSFPKIADANWWKLRDLFKKKVPALVTPTYLATALSMGEASARANLIGPFKRVGIIDEDGKPTDLAYDWRDDHKYTDVCKNIFEKCYPEEVRDLFHTADADFQKLTNWFMSHARCGEPAAKQFSRFYLLLLKADLKDAEAATAKKEPKAKATKPAVAAKKSASSTSKNEAPVMHQPQTPNHSTQQTSLPPRTSFLSSAPELHINIQLHISPESSAEQIDKIFESMAKHLKDFNK